MNGQLPFSLALTLRRTTGDQIDTGSIGNLPSIREIFSSHGTAPRYAVPIASSTTPGRQ